MMSRQVIRLLPLLFSLCASPVVLADAYKQDPAKLEKTELLNWNGQSVSAMDFHSDLLRIPEVNRYEYLQSDRRIEEELQSLLTNRTLAERARKAGLDKSAFVQKEIAIATERLLASKYLLHFKENMDLPDFAARAQEYYLVNQNEFKELETVNASHVLIDTKARSEAEALARAQEVKAKLAAGEDFKKIALDYSDDPSAKRNAGSLGYFSRGKMVKAFEEAAFAMTTPGQLSDPIRSPFGFHIIRFDDRKPGGIRPFEAVKASIVDRLKRKYVADRTTELLASIRQNPNLKRNEEAIKALKTAPVMGQ